MTEELREKIAALRAIAPELNRATDEASAVVQGLDKLLGQDLSIGVSVESRTFASVFSEDSDGRRIQSCSTLAYGRIGGTFRLHVVDETGVLDDDGDWSHSISRQEWPWPNCDRETKLKSFKMLPELLGLILGQAQQRIEESRATARTVRELMDAMGGSPAPSAEEKDEPEPASAKTKLRATPTLPRRPAP